MIGAVVLAAGIWLSTDNAGEQYCMTQVSSSVWTDCVRKIGEETDSDTGVTSDVWQYNNIVWAGNPYCAEGAWFPTAPEAANIGACRLRSLPSSPEPGAPEMESVF